MPNLESGRRLAVSRTTPRKSFETSSMTVITSPTGFALMRSETKFSMTEMTKNLSVDSSMMATKLLNSVQRARV